jgi:hypothetical protein
MFEFSAFDRRIHVRFPGRPALANRSFIVAPVPMQKPRSIFDTVGETLSTAATTVFFAPLTFTGLASPKSAPATVNSIEDAEFSLKEHELAAEDVVGGDSADDSPEPWRNVCVVTENALHTAEARRRCQWEVVPLLNQRVTTGRRRS